MKPLKIFLNSGPKRQRIGPADTFRYPQIQEKQKNKSIRKHPRKNYNFPIPVTINKVPVQFRDKMMRRRDAMSGVLKMQQSECQSDKVRREIPIELMTREDNGTDSCRETRDERVRKRMRRDVTEN